MMRVYYLDEPLSKQELGVLKKALVQLEGLKSIQSIEQVRVPDVLPTPGKDGLFEEDLFQLAHSAKKNLFRARLERDAGIQVTWVVPEDTHWGVIFQQAMYEITGFFPYIVQRWQYEGDRLVRGNVRVLDGHEMIVGKK
jgi:hypothetical protein